MVRTGVHRQASPFTAGVGDFVFAYEFSKSILCHIQHPSDWLVRVDQADETVLFSQHTLWSRAATFALAESVIHDQRTSVPQVCVKYLVSIIRQ